MTSEALPIVISGLTPPLISEPCDERDPREWFKVAHTRKPKHFALCHMDPVLLEVDAT